MSKKAKCLYTNMLNRLSMLDEQIFQMKANLEKVREMVNSGFEEEDKKVIQEGAPSNPKDAKAE